MKTNTPKLRFKEFTDEWQEKKLGEIVDFKNGKAHEQDIVESGKYIVLNSKFISTEGKIKKFTDKQTCPVRHNDIVMVMSDIPNGKAIAKCFYIDANDKYTLNQRICSLTAGSSYEPRFLIRKINRNRYYLKFDDGVSQTNLKKDDVLNLPLLTPQKPEQQKIADFLTAVDDKVQKLEEKKKAFEKYKKGIMQAIFSQKIRFKPDGKLARRSLGEVGYPDWEEKRFDDALISLPTKSHQILNSQFSKQGKFPVVDQGQQKIAGYSDDSSHLFSNVPVIVFGDHTTFLKYVDFNFIVGADGTKLLHSKNGDNLKFLYYELEQNKLTPEGYKRHFSVLKMLKLTIPVIEEQEKIAEFLTALDDKINLINNQLEQSKFFKKSLLQRMFV